MRQQVASLGFEFVSDTDHFYLFSYTVGGDIISETGRLLETRLLLRRINQNQA